MRNMYDYAYEYEYQYHPERAGEMFAVVFASLWLAIMIGMLVFMLGSYLLHSFGLYTIAKRMGKKDAWMAFVPFAKHPESGIRRMQYYSPYREQNCFP